MLDDTTTVGALREAMRRFVTARAWDEFHTPKNLAMSIAIEAAELMEHYQWYGATECAERMADPELRDAAADELADILLYCMSFANAADIDISTALLAKLARNEQRFPVERVRGRLG